VEAHSPDCLVLFAVAIAVEVLAHTYVVVGMAVVVCLKTGVAIALTVTVAVFARAIDLVVRVIVAFSKRVFVACLAHVVGA